MTKEIEDRTCRLRAIHGFDGSDEAGSGEGSSSIIPRIDVLAVQDEEGSIAGFYTGRFIAVSFEILARFAQRHKGYSSALDGMAYLDVALESYMSGRSVTELVEFSEAVNAAEPVINDRASSVIFEEVSHHRDLRGTLAWTLINALTWHRRFCCSSIASTLTRKNRLSEYILNAVVKLQRAQSIVMWDIRQKIEGLHFHRKAEMGLPLDFSHYPDVEHFYRNDVLRDIELDGFHGIRRIYLNHIKVFKTAIFNSNPEGFLTAKRNRRFSEFILRLLRLDSDENGVVNDPSLFKIFASLSLNSPPLMLAVFQTVFSTPVQDLYRLVIGNLNYGKKDTMPSLKPGLRIWGRKIGVFYDPFAELAGKSLFMRSFENGIESRLGRRYTTLYAVTGYLVRLLSRVQLDGSTPDFHSVDLLHDFMFHWNPRLKQHRKVLDDTYLACKTAIVESKKSSPAPLFRQLLEIIDTRQSALSIQASNDFDDYFHLFYVHGV